ncbi:MAG TPA: IS5/IS1182 family transposase, partial [Acidimicrobiales bacterium]|nr:IS5/IS1182 family transposase [Acidimicrobiales bacterium]
MLVRLATGCSYEDAERLCGNTVSDTTVRARRDEWIEAGVYDAIAAEALDAYDRIVGLDLSDVAVDGSQHKAPAG